MQQTNAAPYFYYLDGVNFAELGFNTILGTSCCSAKSSRNKNKTHTVLSVRLELICKHPIGVSSNIIIKCQLNQTIPSLFVLMNHI